MSCLIYSLLCYRNPCHFALTRGSGQSPADCPITARQLSSFLLHPDNFACLLSGGSHCTQCETRTSLSMCLYTKSKSFACGVKSTPSGYALSKFLAMSLSFCYTDRSQGSRRGAKRVGALTCFTLESFRHESITPHTIEKTTPLHCYSVHTLQQQCFKYFYSSSVLVRAASMVSAPVLFQETL